MSKLRLTAFLFLLLPATASATPKAAYTWIHLGKGLSYTMYSFAVGEKDRTTIHAFQIDPKEHRIDVLIAENEEAGSSIKRMARKAGALIAINGGFFTPKHTSIGLIIKEGKQVSKLHRTSWWSILQITGGEPAIVSPRAFKPSPKITTALQVGPRLAVDGNIPKLKKGIAARSAVGITKGDKLIIAMTTGHGITLAQLAKRMSASRFEGGLECPDAMALDGGSSSQLFAKIGSFSLDLPGIARVTNGLAVLPKP